jgi:hypothetical protein
MTVFLTEKYMVKQDKLDEFAACVKNLEAMMKKRPAFFKEVKSHRIFHHLFGGTWNGYVEMTELGNLAEVEKFMTRAMKDKEFMTKVYAKFMTVIVPESYSVNIWASYP